VDAIILFDEDTPLKLLEALKPDVLMKGADYAKDKVVGWELVEAYGGRVELLPLKEGYSTTNIIKKSAGVA
ncbi:MAG: bifunctional heptose 7-phosphate kinase/heptose 1-phosphate adenyltransferase, partial [Alphaproteobacteria bacterium]